VPCNVLDYAGRLGEDRDCYISGPHRSRQPPLSVMKGGLSCLDLCLHRTSSNAPHTVPQDLAAFKFKGRDRGSIKLLKLLKNSSGYGYRQVTVKSLV
jgi:hypothetical protein